MTLPVSKNHHERRLLLTGASGFLGWNLCRFAGHAWRITGVVLTHSLDIPEVKIVKADLTHYEELKRLLGETRPHGVVHTAALSTPNFCQMNPEKSRKINVDTAVNLAGLCADQSIPYLFTSTDLVFDGLNPPYREEDPVSPVNTYAEQKALAEEGILRRYPDAVVCRMPLMFGDPGPAGESFIQPMLHAMQKGRELQLFVDEYRTPVSGRDAAHGIFLSLERIGGIIHLGGPERISRYDFGRLLARVFHFSEAQCVPCLQKDVPMPAPRSKDVSLDSSRAFALGFTPGRPEEELEALAGSIQPPVH